jgi:Fur family transcriptional regulator, ferric uptake regulator
VDVEQDEQALAAALREAGHRLTAARVAVWSALAGTPQPGTHGSRGAHGANGTDGPHLSVDEVVERAAATGAGVDRATVYRVLSLLEELGLARASQLDAGGPVRWERSHPDEHFHLRCTMCGTVDHHVGTLVATVREHLDAGHGFRAESVELTVHGRCAGCRAG